MRLYYILEGICMYCVRAYYTHMHTHNIHTFHLSPPSHLLTRDFKNLNTIAMLILLSDGTSFPKNYCARIKC